MVTHQIIIPAVSGEQQAFIDAVKKGLWLGIDENSVNAYNVSAEY